jgi:Holliday junction resolvase-like predicted endonuclease
MKPFHVSVSAEAFAAALFAQAGFDVSVQYGANQPEYDLIVAKDIDLIKVSVKGSQDGGWGLAQSYKEKGNTYHDAIDLWKKDHKGKDTIYCLVQFANVNLGEMPRMYLATVSEIAKHLKTQHNGDGYCSLRENHTYKTGGAKGYSEKIPSEWSFSVKRIEEILNGAG